jgi:Rps23 Pro-64 3,4-dihydroxylase Tpa1-like proline 4-hydroxylase
MQKTRHALLAASMFDLINPAVDTGAVCAQLSRTGFVQINNYLLETTANQLHACLDKQVQWNLAYSDQGHGKQIKAQQLAAMTPAQLRQTLDPAFVQDQSSFSFVYNTFRVIDSWLAGEHAGHPLYELANRMHTQQHLEYARQLTGKKSLTRMDVMAARYLPGHFLTPHDDVHQHEGREVAYILNLTKNWQPEWGGLLHFMDADRKAVTHTFVPTFNTMILFYPPRWHFVSQVANFARQPRYTLTGWMLNT